jgi:trehalose 6-phosphate synthase/phosphatase
MVKNRLIIVSNRLPIILEKRKDNKWNIKPGTGGLVTAMAPVLKNRGGLWIGWPGNILREKRTMDGILHEHKKDIGFNLKAVDLSLKEKEYFYKGFSNEIIWPLFHDFIAHCNFNPVFWHYYKKVNKKFVDVITKFACQDDFIWIHDYHLFLVADGLRKAGFHNTLGFFLHIPFPPPDVFIRLPWRIQILHALLDYNLIGFQTQRDRRNFIQCLRTFIKEIKVIGKGQVVSLNIQDQQIRLGVFPISIDYEEFSHLANSQQVAEAAWYIHENFPDRKIIFGIDRLDYTKGIPERLRAFRNALRRYPELQKKVTFIQVVVPSRREISKYETLKIEIERLIGEINGEFTQMGWVPLQYLFRSLNREELISYYRTSEILFLTPLKDGMNLVAKEYCASNSGEEGILILSEFAGTAAQFQKNVLLVNPHDIEGMADAIHKAYHMTHETRKRRMRRLRQNVRKFNIFWWVDSFLSAAIAKNLQNFPLVEESMPYENIW